VWQAAGKEQYEYFTFIGGRRSLNARQQKRLRSLQPPVV